MGVTIIEKLLRDVPNVGTLYLLMRAKKGKTVQERLQELQQNSVFDRFKELELESRFSKIVAIEGDVGLEHLGISPADREKLIENVNVVFHSAATLDFFQSLKETTNINLRGTRRVVELCQQLRHLDALVHVSSAYVNSYITEVEEKLYPSPDDPEKIIQLSETLSDEALKELEPKWVCYAMPEHRPTRNGLSFICFTDCSRITPIRTRSPSIWLSMKWPRWPANLPVALCGPA